MYNAQPQQQPLPIQCVQRYSEKPTYIICVRITSEKKMSKILPESHVEITRFSDDVHALGSYFRSSTSAIRLDFIARGENRHHPPARCVYTEIRNFSRSIGRDGKHGVKTLRLFRYTHTHICVYT